MHEVKQLPVELQTEQAQGSSTVLWRIYVEGILVVSSGDIEGAVEQSVPVHIANRSQTSVHSIDPVNGSGGIGSSGSLGLASKYKSSSSRSWTASK